MLKIPYWRQCCRLLSGRAKLLLACKTRLDRFYATPYWFLDKWTPQLDRFTHLRFIAVMSKKFSFHSLMGESDFPYIYRSKFFTRNKNSTFVDCKNGRPAAYFSITLVVIIIIPIIVCVCRFCGRRTVKSRIPLLMIHPDSGEASIHSLIQTDRHVVQCCAEIPGPKMLFDILIPPLS